MFNLCEEKMEKHAMAFGPRAMQPGNFGAGARKFRLVEISEENTPNIAKIRDSINSTYSDDGGQLYFLFASENRYSGAMDVNDDRTLTRMKEELQAREDFVNCVYLRDMDELSDKEELRAIEISGVTKSLAVYSASQDTELADDPVGRQKHIDTWLENFSTLPYAIISEDYKRSDTAYLFEQFETNNKDRANPIRFAVDHKKLRDYGLEFDGNNGLPVHEAFRLYTQSANYHPVVAGKSEINMLKESISKLESAKKTGYEKYDVNSYVEQQIANIRDEEKQKNDGGGHQKRTGHQKARLAPALNVELEQP